MTAQDLKLDYFKFYDVANLDLQELVTLKGQFDEEPERALLRILTFFANPVSKNDEPIYDKYAHLNWYVLSERVPDPTRKLVLENQFGRSEILIGPAFALLAPARKYEPGSAFPKQLDHYKVYRTLAAEPLMQEVKLEDQFGADEVRVSYPVAFAVPVHKEHEGRTFQINNEKAHLLIYQITSYKAEKTIRVRDQFGRYTLHVMRSILLAVPTVKQDWKVVD
jgi:hypothetical protein